MRAAEPQPESTRAWPELGAPPVVAGCDFLYAPLADLRLPRSGQWLSRHERSAASTLNDSGRAHAWLAGRLLAKRLLLARLAVAGLSLASSAQVEVRSAGMRPSATVDGQAIPWSLSISHTPHAVLVALCWLTQTSVGVDLVEPAVCSAGFSRLWFSPGEQRWLGLEGEAGVAWWAIKEAVYKAASRGQKFDPRRIEVFPAGADGYRALWNTAKGRHDCAVTVWRTPRRQFAALAVSCTRGEHHDRP